MKNATLFVALFVLSAPDLGDTLAAQAVVVRSSLASSSSTIHADQPGL